MSCGVRVLWWGGGGGGGGVNNVVGLCVVPACFRLAGRVMDPSFPPVLSCLRAEIPLSLVLLLRLCGMPVAELAAFWCCPLRLLDDLHALLCRSCESAECEVAAGAGLWECSRVTKSVATKKFVREAIQKFRRDEMCYVKHMKHNGNRRTTSIFARPSTCFGPCATEDANGDVVKTPRIPRFAHL